jgi:hypothetical protein
MSSARVHRLRFGRRVTGVRMAQNETKPTTVSPQSFIAQVESEQKRKGSVRLQADPEICGKALRRVRSMV